MFYLNIILAVAAIASAAFAFFTGRNAKKAREQKIVYDLMFEYRTVHMLAALRRLHEFYKDCKARKKDLKSIYEIIKRKEDEEYQKKSVDEKTRFLETTIHNQRRLVSQFYAIMKMTLDLKLVPEKYIFRYWPSNTLKKIVDIIDPLENDKDKRLRELYHKAVEYEKKDVIKAEND